jgi:hypothetical protein
MHTGTATGVIVPTSGQIAPATDALCPPLLDEAKPQTHCRRRRKESLISPPAAKTRSENLVRLLPTKYKTAFAIPKPRQARYLRTNRERNAKPISQPRSLARSLLRGSAAEYAKAENPAAPPRPRPTIQFFTFSAERLKLMTIYMYAGSKWKNPGHHEYSRQGNPKPNQCPPERRAAATAPLYQPDSGTCGRSIPFQDFSVSVFSVFPRSTNPRLCHHSTPVTKILSTISPPDGKFQLLTCLYI